VCFWLVYYWQGFKNVLRVEKYKGLHFGRLQTYLQHESTDSYNTLAYRTAVLITGIKVLKYTKA